MSTCKNCGAPMEDGAIFCEKCGQKAEYYVCRACGARLEVGETSCGNCGMDVAEIHIIDTNKARLRIAHLDSMPEEDKMIEKYEEADEEDESIEEYVEAAEEDESIEEYVEVAEEDESIEEYVEAAEEDESIEEYVEAAEEEPTTTAVAVVEPAEKPAVVAATDAQVQAVMTKTKERVGTWIEKAKAWYSEVSAGTEKAKLLKIIGGLCVIIVLLIAFIGLRTSEEDKYRDGVKTIGTDIVELHREMKDCMQTVDLINNEEIAQRLSDDSKIKSIKKKYSELKPPKDMEREHKRLSELIETENQLRNLVRDICHDPGAENVGNKVMQVAKLSGAIDSGWNVISMFEKKESLDGIDQVLKNITMEAKRLVALKKKVEFISAFDKILKKYENVQKQPNAVYKLSIIPRRQDVKYFAGYRNDIEKEKEAMESLRQELNQLKASPTEREFVQAMDIVCKVKAEACSKVLALSYKKIGDAERNRSASQAIELSVAATDKLVEFLRVYNIYRENTKKEINAVALEANMAGVASQIRSMENAI